MNKRLWIINHYAQRPDGTGSTRHYSLAKSLVKHGWSTVIIASSYDIKTKKDEINNFQLSKIVSVDDVMFVLLRTIPFNKSIVLKTLNMLSFFFHSLRMITRNDIKPDIIIGSMSISYPFYLVILLQRNIMCHSFLMKRFMASYFI